MNVLKTSLLSATVLLAVLAATPLLAMESITITEEDIQRLGIEFAPVVGTDVRTGSQAPATVINSPEIRSAITSRYAGTIDQWLLAAGATVSPGTVLASIRSEQVVAVQQDWLAASNSLKQADFERSRDRQLFDDGIIARQRLEQSERNYQQASFNLKSMTETLQQAGFNDSDRRKLLAGDLAPGLYFVTAPAAGILSRRAFAVGDVVEANSQVAVIQQAASPWVRARIPASQGLALQVGQPLSLAGRGEELILRQKDLQVSSASQTVEILAEFSQPTALLPGQLVTLVLPPAEQGVLVPASAVVHSGESTSVYVRTVQGVEVRVLQLRPAGASYLATEGINRGEQVAVKGAATIKGMQLGLGGDE